jgi:hypothetical protein
MGCRHVRGLSVGADDDDVDVSAVKEEERMERLVFWAVRPVFVNLCGVVEFLTATSNK